MKLGIVTAIAIGSHKISRLEERSLPSASILLGLSMQFRNLPHHNDLRGPATEV
jgi:hypothetical protein